MKVTYQVSPECSIQQEVGGVKVAFKLLAHLSEVFGVKQCGNCKSPNVKPRFRSAARRDNGAKCEYYSYVCADCKHEFKFGQKQEDGAPLFPKGWEPPYQGDNDGGQQPQYGQEPVYQYGPEGYQTPAPPLRQTAPQQAPASTGGIPF